MTDRARWASSKLGVEFSESALLEQALTHRSASKRNNERLEFLGDAQLGLSVARLLYSRRPDSDEGDLSRSRAALVNRQALAKIGRHIGIDRQLRLGAGELSSGGAQRESALADAVEAVIGAVLLDQGEQAADALVGRLLSESLESLPDSESLKDAKTRLQEWLQARRIDLPAYSLEATRGSDHNQEFEVSCTVAACEASVTGSGTSRRRAEQAAAKAMLEELESGGR